MSGRSDFRYGTFRVIAARGTLALILGSGLLFAQEASAQSIGFIDINAENEAAGSLLCQPTDLCTSQRNGGRVTGLAVVPNHGGRVTGLAVVPNVGLRDFVVTLTNPSHFPRNTRPASHRRGTRRAAPASALPRRNASDVDPGAKAAQLLRSKTASGVRREGGSNWLDRQFRAYSNGRLRI